MSTHTHPRRSEFNIFWIPADPDIPMQLKIIGADWQSMSRFVDGYIEVISQVHLPELYCGCSMVMVVNEEGLLKKLPENLRATALIPPDKVNMTDSIVGDVFLVGCGQITPDHPEDDPEVDFFTLPSALRRWEGPGHPLPTSYKMYG